MDPKTIWTAEGMAMRFGDTILVLDMLGEMRNTYERYPIVGIAEVNPRKREMQIGLVLLLWKLLSYSTDRRLIAD